LLKYLENSEVYHCYSFVTNKKNNWLKSTRNVILYLLKI